MSAARRDHRDPGAQPERTQLAWRRTTLTFTLVVVLAARRLVIADRHPAAAAVLAVALNALLWVGFLLLAHRRMRALAGTRPPAAEPSSVVGAAGVIMAITLLAGVVLATGG